MRLDYAVSAVVFFLLFVGLLALGYNDYKIDEGDDNADQQFAVLGLFGTALFVLGMLLIYSANGELQVIIGALIVHIAWVFGLLSIGWIGASAIALFGFFLVGIGRYARSRS